jgi:hypothetical protein
VSAGRNAWRGVTTAPGSVGTRSSPSSACRWRRAGANIALPGLGTVVGGPAVMLTGLLTIAAAVALGDRLRDGRLP